MILVGLTMTLFSEKMLISTRCTCGFIPNLRKKSWMVSSRLRPRFFDQVGHETMYASSGNKHFFTKSCHRQTYQNYEQSRQKLGTILENKVS